MTEWCCSVSKKTKRKKEKCTVIIGINEYTFDLVKEMVDQGFQEKIYIIDYNLSAEVEKQFISIGAEILDYNSFHPEDTTYENRTINKIVLAAPMNQLILDKRFKEKLRYCY